MRRFLGIGLVAGLLGFGTGPVAADYVTGLDPQGDNFLALRSGPGSDYQMLQRMPPDTILTVLETHGSWRRVELQDGSGGWAYGKYIAEGLPPGYQDDSMFSGEDPVTGQTGAITGGTARLFDRASDRSNVIGSTLKGSGVIILGESGRWLRVLTDSGQVGYLHDESVAIGVRPAAFNAPSPATSEKSGKRAAAAPDGFDWTTYVNPRFGTRIDYPRDYFRAEPPPANNDGRSFSSTDGRANFVVFGQYNVFDKDLTDLQQADRISGRYDSVTHEQTGADWYVLSGFIGEFVFYRRVMLRDGGEVIHAFEIIYPASDKARMDPAITRMSRSFDAP